MGDRLFCHHLAHVASARRIPDHGCAASDQGDRFVARHLQPFHQTQRHKMADVQTVRRGIKSNIKHGLSIVKHLTNMRFIRHLSNQSARFQFLVNLHVAFSFVFLFNQQCCKHIQNHIKVSIS